MRSPSFFCIGKLYIYISSLFRGDSSTAPELYLCLYWYVCASYNGVWIDTFVNLIMVSVLLFLCMVYNLTVGHTLSWYFVLSLSRAYLIPPLRHGYICVCINMFVNVILMITVISLCTLYNLILGCATFWASCHAYFLYIIGYSIVIILVELYSQK